MPAPTHLFPAALVACLVALGLYFDHAPLFNGARVPSKEIAMNDSHPPITPDAGKARHGPRSEVTWEGGSGRQPYGNQGSEEAAEPGSDEYAEGNRGERSGRNLDQLDEARRKP